jgi:hypothetical protein
MRKELKEIIEEVVKDLIRREDDMRLPYHESWEYIEYQFEDFISEVEENYEYTYARPIYPGVNTSKEIKEYAMECFDDVLEKYETEIMKMRKDWKRDMEIMNQK